MFTLEIVKFLMQDVLPNLKAKDSVVCLSRSGIIPRELYKVKKYMLQHVDHVTSGNYTGKELLLDAGFKQYDDIDFVPNEGVSIVHNLNEHIPSDLHQKYDLVLECGTMEHIFDIAQVFRNMVSLCKVGGTICHISPLTWLNHGFYNFSLTVFYDVYRTNGFTDLKFWMMNWPKNYGDVGSSPVSKVDFTPNQILQPVGTDFLMVAFTACKQDSHSFKNPIQAAYDPELALNTPLRIHRT
jgi:hypothetical protein